jgi:hypothetical protein
MKPIFSIYLLCMIFMSGVTYGKPYPNQLIRDFKCYEAWKGSPLTEKGGGPEGSHWNPTDIFCEADFIDLNNDPSIDYLEIQLSFGHGKAFKSVEKTFLKQVRSLNDQLEKLTQIISAPKRVFLIPHSVLTTELKFKTKPFDIYQVSFALQVFGYRTNREKIGPERREIKGKFAFGE